MIASATIEFWHHKQECGVKVSRTSSVLRPWCRAECLLFFGASSYLQHTEYAFEYKTNIQDCNELDVRVRPESAELGKPGRVPLLPVGQFECVKTGDMFSGRVNAAKCSYKWNLDVNCSKPTLRLTQQIKGSSLSSVCVPACRYYDQTIVLADQFWWCERQMLHSVLPTD